MKKKMNIGKRLRTLRLHRNLTQKALGILLGYNNSPEIRVAQYELGQRSPRTDAVAKMSDVLNVAPEAINIPKINSTTELMHLLFGLEEFFNLKVDSLNGKMCFSFKNKELKPLLNEWLNKYIDYKNGNISEYEYKEWQYQYSGKK